MAGNTRKRTQRLYSKLAPAEGDDNLSSHQLTPEEMAAGTSVASESPPEAEGEEPSAAVKTPPLRVTKAAVKGPAKKSAPREATLSSASKGGVGGNGDPPPTWRELEKAAVASFFNGQAPNGSPSLIKIAEACAHLATVDTEGHRLVIVLETLVAACLKVGVATEGDLPPGNSAYWLVQWAEHRLSRSQVEQWVAERQREDEIMRLARAGAHLVLAADTAVTLRVAAEYQKQVTPRTKWLSARHLVAAMLKAPGIDAQLGLGQSVSPGQLLELRAHMLKQLSLAPVTGERVDLWTSILVPPKTIGSEIDAILERLGVKAQPTVRSVLVQAMAYSAGSEAVQPLCVAAALLQSPPPEAPRAPDAPSALLAASGLAVPLKPLRTPPPKADDLANPSQPVKFADTLELLLKRGFETQKQAFRNAELGTKGLVAGLLTASFAERGDAFVRHKVDFEEVPGRFRDVVRQRFAGKPDLHDWFRALEYETATLPKLSHDQPGQGPANDKLGITNDALAIAQVAAGSSTNLPLAFGIFGNWGAGKSFFMRLVQDRIASFVDSGAKDDGFEHDIVQIQFNAWHYAETNLWASLVGHIFDELDRWMTRGDRSPTAADEILQRLATSRQLTLEAAAELAMRRKEHRKAQTALTTAQGQLATAQAAAARAPDVLWRSAFNAVKAKIFDDKELKQQFGAIAAATGISKLETGKADIVNALAEINRSASAGNAALGALRATVGSWGTVLLALLALAGVPLLLFLLNGMLAAMPQWSGFAGLTKGIEALGGALAMLAVLAGSFAKRARSIADKLAELKQTVDAEIVTATTKEKGNVEQAEAKLAETTAGVEKAKSLVQATGEQVAAALKDYAEETGAALRLKRFVRARAGNDGYGKHLGLVSTIRKDFEQLESLMLNDTPPAHLEEARKHYEARVKALIADTKGALEPNEIEQLEKTTQSPREVAGLEDIRFRRIILYIDDLDRCEPDKVVEILQAVNMLLSFRLFVVMVAVDARWLSRSLEKRYPDFFGRIEPAQDDDDKPAAASLNGNATAAKPKVATAPAISKNDKGRRSPGGNGGTPERATAADYLEKIFQIPYWVPPMSAKASMSLVKDLFAPGEVVDEVAITPAPVENHAPDKPEGPGGGQPPPPPAEPLPEDEQPRIDAAPQQALALTGKEATTLALLSPFLGGSPRRARRFVNVYRVAKASLTPSEVRELEAGAHRALATQLAIATGAPNAFGDWMRLCNTGVEPDFEGEIPDEFDRANIVGALGAFRGMEGQSDKTLIPLAAQSARAARFSFAVPDRQAGN